MDEVADLFRSGLPIREVSRRTGASFASVRAHLARTGLHRIRHERIRDGLAVCTCCQQQKPTRSSRGWSTASTAAGSVLSWQTRRLKLAGVVTPRRSTGHSLTSRMANARFAGSGRATGASVGGTAASRWTMTTARANCAAFSAAIAIGALDGSRIPSFSSRPPCVTSRGSSRRSEKADHTNNC
jgi:hypothetical protein